jgi:hypothetical protein
LKYGIYVANALIVGIIVYFLMAFDVFFSGQHETNLMLKLLAGNGNIAVNPSSALD